MEGYAWDSRLFVRAIAALGGKTDCPCCDAADWMIAGTEELVSEDDASVLVVVCERCGLVQRYLEARLWGALL